MSFCSLIKGIAQKISMLSFVLINSVLLNLFVFGSCAKCRLIVMLKVKLCFAVTGTRLSVSEDNADKMKLNEPGK